MILKLSRAEQIMELFYSLMENKIFLVRNIDSNKMAQICNCEPSFLNDALKEQVGFSLADILSLYRIAHARELLTIGIKYRFVYKYSGFKTKKEFEKAMECIAN